MTTELDRWLFERRWKPPVAFGGQWVRFQKMHGLVMHLPVYSVITRRGEGFSIGRLEYRNQWGTYAFYPDPDVMVNRAILAEIHSAIHMLDRGLTLQETA